MNELYELHINYHSRTGMQIKIFQPYADRAYRAVWDNIGNEKACIEIDVSDRARAIVTMKDIATVALLPHYDEPLMRQVITHGLNSTRLQASLRDLDEQEIPGSMKS